MEYVAQRQEYAATNCKAEGSNPSIFISFGISPSGKAMDFESITRRFESFYPKLSYFLITIKLKVEIHKENIYNIKRIYIKKQNT